jgi:hypothetical protein
MPQGIHGLFGDHRDLQTAANIPIEIMKTLETLLEGAYPRLLSSLRQHYPSQRLSIRRDAQGVDKKSD